MTTGSAIDIAVASSMRNRRLIVVAVKPTHDLEAATVQLSDYLRRSHVPVGLLVGRDVIRLLRYGYKIEPDVEMIGEFPVALAHGLVASDDPAEYADRVQDWLESLGNRWDTLDEPLRSASGSRRVARARSARRVAPARAGTIAFRGAQGGCGTPTPR